MLNIEDAIEEAIKGLVNNCKERLIKEWLLKLMADPDVETIPANEDEFIEYVTSRPDYKNRAERDAEQGS